MESIRRQTLQDYEVIVADDRSTDLTQSIALKFGARIVVGNGIGEYPSRNAAAKVARGAIMIFTGADVLMPRRLLSTAASKFDRDPRLGAIYCPTYPYDASPWAKIEYLLFYVLNTIIYLVTGEANASTAFFAVRTEAFRKTRGFQNIAFADSDFSRHYSKSIMIRPCLDMVVFVSGRRTTMGIVSFNRYHIGMIIGMVFRVFRKSRWLTAENQYRIGVHTRSRQTPDEEGPTP